VVFVLVFLVVASSIVVILGWSHLVSKHREDSGMATIPVSILRFTRRSTRSTSRGVTDPTQSCHASDAAFVDEPTSEIEETFVVVWTPRDGRSRALPLIATHRASSNRGSHADRHDTPRHRRNACRERLVMWRREECEAGLFVSLAKGYLSLKFEVKVVVRLFQTRGLSS